MTAIRQNAVSATAPGARSRNLSKATRHGGHVGGVEPPHGPGQNVQRLHAGQHGLAVETVIMQVGAEGREAEARSCGYAGKIFHIQAVFSSTSTGVLLAFTAQWRVNPVQAIAWVSSCVMT